MVLVADWVDGQPGRAGAVPAPLGPGRHSGIPVRDPRPASADGGHARVLDGTPGDPGVSRGRVEYSVKATSSTAAAGLDRSAARSDEQLRLRPRAGQEIRLLPDAVRPALVRSSMVRAKSPHLGR